MQSSTDFDTPEELIEAFCQFLARLGNSPQTVKGRRSDLLALVRWSEEQKQGQFDLNNFVTEKFEPYRTWLLSQFKDSTVNRRLTSLNLFLNWSVRQGLLHPRALPAINSIKVQPRSLADVPLLTVADVSRLLEAVKGSENHNEIAIVTLLAGTGLRISDICLLKWQDVDVRQSDGTITLAKTKFSQRVRLPIHDSGARQALLSLAASKKHSKTDLVFQQGQQHLTRRAVEMLIERYSKIAGLPKITPKMLRYSFIRNLVAKGISPHEAAIIAGFERVEMIRRFYDIGMSEFLQSVSIVHRMC